MAGLTSLTNLKNKYEVTRVKTLDGNEGVTSAGLSSLARLKNDYAKKAEEERLLSSKAGRTELTEREFEKVSAARDELNAIHSEQAKRAIKNAGVKYTGRQRLNKTEQESQNQRIKDLRQQIKDAGTRIDIIDQADKQHNLYLKQTEQAAQIKEHGNYNATINEGENDAYYRAVNNLVRVGSKAELASNRATGNVVSANSGSIIPQMTEEERNTYNYIFDTEGGEAAKDYLNVLEYTLASRYKEQRTKDAQEMANSGFGGAAAGTAMSIMEGAVSDTGGGLSFYGEKFLRDIGWADDSLPINYQKTFASSTWSNALQEQVTQNIDNPVGQFLYGTGVSIADNMARNLIFAPFGSAGTLTVMAARVAGQSVNEALSRGATEEEAAAYGVSSAIGEVIGEVAPLDHLLGMVNADPKTGKEWLKAILKQAELEASGEAITTVWNDLVSAQALGDLSDYNMAKAEYIQQGMSETEAEKQATKDALHQIFLDALGGAISGVAMGGGASVVNRAVSRASGERAENNIASSLVSDIDESEVQKRAAKYEKKGMSPEEATQKAREDIQNKKAKEYTEQGMSAEEAAEAVKADDIATEERNKKLREEILDRGLNAEEGSKANTAAKAIQEKLKSGESVSADEWKNLIKSTRAQVSLAETKDAIKKAAQKSGESLADTDVDVMAAAMEKNFQGKNMSEAENKLIKGSEAAKKAYSELTGLNYETGEVIPEIVEEKKKAAIRDILGEQVTDYAGENRSNGYKNALSKTYRAYLSLVEEANAGDIVQLQAKLSPEGYAQLFSEFYEFGKSGEYSADVLKADLEKRGAVRGEALKALETAYELGRSEAKSSGIKNAKVRQAELNAKKHAEREKKATAPKGVARSITEKELKTDAAKNAGAKSIDMKRHFSQKQRYAIAVAREFAKMTDINIVFYQTEDGKGANGWYDRETDTIYIDLFSGFNDEQAMLRTLSHELTHFMEKYSPEHYEEYKQFLLDYYYNKDNGETLSRLVEQQKRLAPNQSAEYWQNEIVANASEMFVNDESAMRALISEHADVAQTVDQWFKKMNYALRRAFKGVVTSGSAEADAAKELQANVEAFSEAQKRWSALLKESVEAKKAVGAAEESGEAKFSIKYDVNNKPFVVVENDILSGKSKNQWADIVKKNLAAKFPNGVVVGNNLININKQSRMELAFSEYTKWLAKNNKGIYADKFRATNNADEIILASREYINEGLKHARKDTIKDFARGNVLMRIGSSDYNAEVIVGTKQNGEMLLYDIVNLQKTEIKERKSTKPTSQTAVSRKGTLPNENIMLQNKENVNTQFSMRVDSEEGSGKSLTVSDLGKIQYQLRIEDKNRLDILDKQETRLTADLKTLEKAYAEAIKAEYERSIKPSEETSRRAAEINRKAAKRYMNEVGATFHVPKDERSMYLLPIINEIIDKGPAISESEGLIEQLYREAYRHSQEYVADDGALYKKERDALRDTAIYVDPGTRSDVGDYERFRKNNMGSLKLTSDPSAISLDGLYDMLANNYPDFFSGSTDGAEQLYELSAFMKNKGRVESIGDYMTEDEFVKWAMNGDSGLDTELDNLFDKTVGSFLSEASRKERERGKAAKVNRAMENVRSAVANYDRAQEYARAEGVLAGQMEQGAKDAVELRKAQERFSKNAESYENRIKAYRNKLSEVREKRDAALKARREAFENYKAERADSARREVLRKRIAKGVRSLNTMLLNPTDNKHIPQDLRGAVAGFLSNFTDNSSVFSKSKLDALAKAYSQIAEESSDLNDLYDPDIKDYLDKMEKTVEGKRLSELSADELFFVQTITDYFTHIVRDGNKLLVDGRRQNISELASETVRAAENHGYKTYRGGTLGGAVNWADKYLNYDNITPYYFFNRMGGGMKRLYNDMLYNSQLKYSQDINEDQKFMASVYEKYHVWDWSSANPKNKNDILRFETARKGAWLEMTRNEVLTAYATYKRGKALGDGAAHMKEGGIVVKSKTPEKFMQEYVKSSKGVQLDIADIQKMFRFLTDEQKACADAVVNYLTTVEGARRNETSMALYGYKKFNETYYFPYRVASDYTKSHAGQEVSPDGTKQAGGSKMLKNMGSAKALTPNANAAIVIDDFFKVVAESMNDTARYHAFAVQQDNFMRVLNYKDTVDAEHGSTSVKQAIRDSYGTEGINYITGLMGDSFGGAVQLNDDNVFGKLFGKFKKTAVAANLSVAIQQPSAIMRATAMIDGKYLTKTVGQKNALEEMYDYSSTAFLKNMGRFDIGTGRSAEQYILKPELKGKDYVRQLFATGEYSTGELDDVTGFLSEKADWVTWGHIMNAVMAEIEDTTDLKRGTEEFKRAAGRRFDEVVNATQVYDSILVKSPMMRDQRGIAQIISAFKMEPTLSYNLFVDSISKEKVAAKSAARGLSALALNVFANALLKSIIGALRDRDEDKTYLEKYAEKLANNIGSDLIPILNLPGVDAISEAIQGFTTELPEMGMISDTVSAGNKALKKIKKGDWGGALGELTVVFNLFGLPVRNIYRDFAAIFNTAVNTKPLKDTSFAGIYKAAVEGFLDSSTIYGAGKALGLIDTSKAAGIKKAMRKGDSIEIRKATNKLIKEYVASGKSENEAKGYIKGALTNYWKPLYQNANSTERIKIRKALYATGIYENTDAVVKMCDNWLKDD